MSEIIDGMEQIDIYDWLNEDPEDIPVETKSFDMLRSQSYLPSVIIKRNSYKLLVKE